MKIIKVILLLSLVLKLSTNVDGWLMSMFSGSSCCQSTEMSMSCESDASDSDTKDCCGDTCDCLCCGHIFTVWVDHYTIPWVSEDNHKTSFDFHADYHYLFADLVWQPPRHA